MECVCITFISTQSVAHSMPPWLLLIALCTASKKRGEKEFATVAFQEIHFKMRIMNYGKVPAEDMVHNISSEIEEGLW